MGVTPSLEAHSAFASLADTMSENASVFALCDVLLLLSFFGDAVARAARRVAIPRAFTVAGDGGEGARTALAAAATMGASAASARASALRCDQAPNESINSRKPSSSALIAVARESEAAKVAERSAAAEAGLMRPASADCASEARTWRRRGGGAGGRMVTVKADAVGGSPPNVDPNPDPDPLSLPRRLAPSVLLDGDTPLLRVAEAERVDDGLSEGMIIRQEEKGFSFNLF